MQATATIAARLDRLPASRHVRRMVALISLGGWFEYYDLFFTAYIAVGLYRDGLFTPTTRGMFDLAGFASFIASLFTGLFIGTIAFAGVSDRFGRRLIFTFALLWYSAGTLAMAFQTTPQGIDFWRLIASIGLGVELVNIDTYVSELVPTASRGRAFAFSQAVMFTAVPAVALVSWALVPQTILGLSGWRWVVLIGAAGAVVVWWLRRGLPESPRWLAQRGRGEEARRMVEEIERAVSAEHGPLPEPRAFAGEEDRIVGGWREMWAAPYRSRTIMLVVYNLFQTVGYYGFASWVPTLLLAQGVEATRSLAYTAAIAVAAPLGPLAGMAVADRFERKWQIVGAAAAIALFGLAFSQQRGAAAVIFCGLLLTLANNWLSFSFHAYQAELYPTRIRAQAVGFVYSWSRFSTIFTGFLIAFLLRRAGTTGVFVCIAGAMAVVCVVIAAFGPATTGRRLEAITE
jgi:MFS transporter, putative metabolite:H+ symporter